MDFENLIRSTPLRLNVKPPLPDVARDTVAPVRSTLEKVGMAGVETALRLRDGGGAAVIVPARADVFVSLDDPEAKGIHMSRLFLALQSALGEDEFSFPLVERILHSFVSSQAETSRSSQLRLHFDYLVQRRSLLSDHWGWRTYPVVVGGALIGGKTTFTIDMRIAYSSTCPCSAALARQLIQERFRQEFRNERQVDAGEVYQWLGTEEAVCATPHSQRSYADVTVVLGSAADAPDLPSLLDLLEKAIGTPVQTTVKREDEQEFARLNAANLMFVEDAARRFKIALDGLLAAVDYRVRVSHLESLHPHDAVAIATKGVPGGLSA